ncbi:MAG TPA: DinB family protein [Bacteroidota bacterium]|nr:DinB family protein [Bacteroidota bacterium]
MNLADIRLLYEFNYWAKARMLGVVESLPEEDLYKDFKTSFKGIHGTLVHLCAAENVWLQRFTGNPSPKFLKVDDLPKYADVKAKWLEVENGMLAYISSLTEERLVETFSFVTSDGKSISNLRWHTLQHLVNHGTYHRGQITSLIRQLGGTPVSTDLIAFYRQLKTK